MGAKFDWMGRPIHKKGTKPHSKPARMPVAKNKGTHAKGGKK